MRIYIIKPPKYFCDLIEIFLTKIKGDPKMAIFTHCALSSLLKSKFLYLSMHWSMVIRDQQAENDEPKNENENVDDNK